MKHAVYFTICVVMLALSVASLCGLFYSVSQSEQTLCVFTLSISGALALFAAKKFDESV